MKWTRIVKNHGFAVVVAMGYGGACIALPELGITALENTGYYLKEMMLIMPVIFVLTALLDLWVPKESISRHLGKKSGIKGVVLSFVLGSISAGPVYAAFPVCVMLHKKGASIRNIVVILSSWAVIKIPMLLNEVKFLGLRFMAIRWVLTVLAIVVFSWILSRLIKEIPLPVDQEQGQFPPIVLDAHACMGCSLCARTCPEIFGMRGKKAYVRTGDDLSCDTRLLEAIDQCPVDAIVWNREEERSTLLCASDD